MKKENEENEWYVIRTMSRQERKVATRLEQINIHYYLPLVKTISQWTDRKKTVEKPLFSGYVFIKKTSKYFDILQLPGVVSIIKHNRKIAIVKQSEINTIKSIKPCQNLKKLQKNLHSSYSSFKKLNSEFLKDL